MEKLKKWYKKHTKRIINVVFGGILLAQLVFGSYVGYQGYRVYNEFQQSKAIVVKLRGNVIDLYENVEVLYKAAIKMIDKIEESERKIKKLEEKLRKLRKVWK